MIQTLVYTYTHGVEKKTNIENLYCKEILTIYTIVCVGLEEKTLKRVSTFYHLSKHTLKIFTLENRDERTGSVSGIGARLPRDAISKTIDEVKRVAGEHGDVGDSLLELQLDIPGGGGSVKAGDAGIAVGEGGAGPGLDVAHLPLEGSVAEMLQLVQRLAQLTHRVGYLLHAVTHRNSLPRSETLRRGL